MKTIRLLLISIVIGICVSCVDKIDAVNNEETLSVAEESSETFARILSMAIYDSESLREYIKDESLKRFDNDFDVFYPFVKNEIVEKDMTFRDILLNYSSDEELSAIESLLPMLNIYVPDLSWFVEDGFNAYNWDTAYSEIAVFNAMTDNLYGAGELMGSLSSDMIPASPLLIIKNNERLKMSSSTKSGDDITYEFRSDAYDCSKNIATKFDPSVSERELPIEECNLFYPASGLHSSVIEAWEELGDVNGASERDYVYYGMTKTQTEGVLNTRARELLLRFRIDPQKYERIADNSSEDPVLNDPTDKIKNTELTDAQLLAQIWKDGCFEFEFDVVVGLKEGGSKVQTLSFSVPPGEIFQMSKVKVEFWHKTWFTARKWKYYFDIIKVNSKIDNIVQKWYYPDTHTMIVPWDLYTESNNVIIHAREYDQDITYTEKKSGTFKYSNNFSNNGGLEVDAEIVKVSFGTSSSEAIETFNTNEYTLSYTTTSDDLGSVVLRYMDPVITGRQVTDGIEEYELFTVSSGSIEMCFVPYVF